MSSNYDIIYMSERSSDDDKNLLHRSTERSTPKNKHELLCCLFFLAFWVVLIMLIVFLQIYSMTVRKEWPSGKRSDILVDAQKEQLYRLCNFPHNATLRLIYKGTRDGFGYSSFHSKCDNQPNTLFLIKSTSTSNQLSVFGGFTKAKWDQSNSYKSDPDAFLFTIVNIYKKPPIRLDIENPTQSIYCGAGFGPTFGAHTGEKPGVDHDLHISGLADSNINPSSHSYLGSYSSRRYFYNSSNFLAGSSLFKIDEIEAFVVDFDF